MKKISLLLACLLLVACANPSTSKDTSEKDSSKKDKLTLVLDWTPNTNHTGIYVAQEKGYFEEEGIELEIVQPPEGGAESLVASGKAQLGVSFQDSIAPAWASKDPLPVTAIAAIIQHNTSGLVSKKDLGIDSMGKLPSHNYATWSNPVELAIIQSLVEEDGGDYEQVELIPQTVTDVVSALKSNVDSVWIYYGWDGIATELAGIETNYIDFAKTNPIFDYYSPIIIASDKFLEEEPELAKKALSAITRGYEFAIENPEESAEILVKANPELDIEMVSKSQEFLAKEYQNDAEKWGVIDKDRWNRFYSWLAEKDLIETKIPEDFGFTNEYLPE